MTEQLDFSQADTAKIVQAILAAKQLKASGAPIEAAALPLERLVAEARERQREGDPRGADQQLLAVAEGLLAGFRADAQDPPRSWEAQVWSSPAPRDC